MGALGATLSAEKSALSGRGSMGPPSRDRETWILVSLVLRFMRAVRREGRLDMTVNIVVQDLIVLSGARIQAWFLCGRHTARKSGSSLGYWHLPHSCGASEGNKPRESGN